MDNIITQTIKRYIAQDNAVFVLPTQIAATNWALWTIKYLDAVAIPSERFLSWDTFKEKFQSVKDNSAKVVDKYIRRLYSEHLLYTNSKAPFLKKIIPPMYAKNYSGFVSFIEKILPSLALYKKYESAISATNHNKNNSNSGSAPITDEDSDYIEIFLRYKTFLKENNLYESSYSVPPFIDDGNKYYVFYPAIFSDYYEYKSALEDATNITLISDSGEGVSKSGTVIEFSDSRREINYIARYIRKLHDEKGVDYSEVAIHIPNIDAYAPYVERELRLFSIPYTKRAAITIEKNRAGSLLPNIAKVASSTYTLESLKQLLLNESLPWKSPSLNDALLTFGKNNNCLTDVWEKSFSACNNDERLSNYFKSLKDAIEKLTGSKTFSELQQHYFNFRDTFFSGEYTKQSDLIIGHIMTSLAHFNRAVKLYKELEPANPFSFFVSFLQKDSYTPQESDDAVNILSYKIAAASPYRCSVIIDSAQSSVSSTRRELDFLSDESRARLLGRDSEDNLTDTYLSLYRDNSDYVLYTASNKTFTGYAVPVSTLTAAAADYSEVAEDPYNNEENAFLKGDALNKVTAIQKTGFNNWVNNSIKRNEGAINLSSPLPSGESKSGAKGIISESATNNSVTDGAVSQSALKDFFFCPTYFFLKRVCYVGKEVGFTNGDDSDHFMKRFDIGNFYHKAFELYFKALENSNTIFSDTVTEDQKTLLLKCANDAIKELAVVYISRTLLETQEDALFQKLLTALGEFCKTFSGMRVVGVEQTYNKDGVDGRVDLILYDNSSDSYTLIDIKSTESATPKDFYYDEGAVDSIFNAMDFQIPLYTYLIESALKDEAGKSVTISNAGFFVVSIGSNTTKHYKSVYGAGSSVSREDFQVTIERALECVDYYNKTMEDGFDFHQKTQEKGFDWDRCNGCFYCAICRRTFVIDGVHR